MSETLAVWRPAVIGAARRKKDGTRAKRDFRVEAMILEGTTFAVHRTLTTDRVGAPLGNWTVTHVPTGYAAILHARDEQAARAAAEALARSGVDWVNAPLLVKGTFTTFPVRVQRRVKRIVREATT